MKAGFQVVRESFYRLLSKQVNGETQKQVAGWKESSFSSSSPQVAAFTFEPNFSSLPEAVVADPATKPMIQVKLVAMSAYEVAIYAKKTPPPPPGTSIAVANPVITCKINLPTNFSYSTSDVVYLPEEELHRIDTQLYNEVIVRMFPPLTESPMLSFISESSLIHIASFLLSKDLLQLQSTAHRIYDMLKIQLDDLWKILYLRDFPIQAHGSVSFSRLYDFNPLSTSSKTNEWYNRYKESYRRLIESIRYRRSLQASYGQVYPGGIAGGGIEAIDEQERQRRRNLYRLYIGDEFPGNMSPFPSFVSPIDMFTGPSQQPYPPNVPGGVLAPPGLILPPATPIYPHMQPGYLGPPTNGGGLGPGRSRDTWF